MKLIVGLGNPGARYAGTRHNVGFDVVDEVARRRALAFESSPAEALMARERGPGARLMLAKPLTFMNLSGRAVGDLVRYYRFDLDDVLIVADDVNLPLGRLRARRGGSDGGHNGLRSVIDVLGTACGSASIGATGGVTSPATSWRRSTSRSWIQSGRRSRMPATPWRYSSPTGST